MASCALARRGELGADVERLDAAVDHVALARQTFSAREAEHVATAREAARVEAFFAYWTLKEAYAKARGLGFSLDTTASGFDLGPPDALRGVGDEAGRWRFLRAAPTQATRLALAAAAPLDLSTVVPREVGVADCLAVIASGPMR